MVGPYHYLPQFLQSDWGGVVYLSGDLPRACQAPNNFSIRKGYSVVTIYRDRSRT